MKGTKLVARLPLVRAAQKHFTLLQLTFIWSQSSHIATAEVTLTQHSSIIYLQ